MSAEKWGIWRVFHVIGNGVLLRKRVPIWLLTSSVRGQRWGREQKHCRRGREGKSHPRTGPTPNPHLRHTGHSFLCSIPSLPHVWEGKSWSRPQLLPGSLKDAKIRKKLKPCVLCVPCNTTPMGIPKTLQESRGSLSELQGDGVTLCKVLTKPSPGF